MKRRCTLGLFVLLMLVGATATRAQQQGEIAGTIVEAATNEPLPGVNVVVAGTLLGAATDAEGHFEIGPLAPGRYTLQASAIGFREARAAVQVVAGEETTVSLRLEERGVEMGGIEVTALRPDLQPTAEVDTRRIREVNARETGDLVRSLPGMNAVRRGALGLDPNVRGLSETQVGVYVDGMRLFPAGPLRMDSQISHFDPTSIRSMEVVKGPYALTWGAGNMSAIRVQTRGENPPHGWWHGSLQSGYNTNLESFETAASLNGTEADLTYWIHGAYREGNDYEAGRGAAIPADYESGEVRGRVGYRLTSSSRLTVKAGYQDQRDLDYPGRLLNAELFETTTVSTHYEWNQARGTLRSVDVQGYWYDIDHLMTNAGKPTAEAGTFPNGNPRPPLVISVDAEIQNVGGRASAQFVPSDGTTLEVGGDIYSADRNATRPFEAIMPDGRRVVPPFYRDGNGAPLDEAWPDVNFTNAGLFANATRMFGRFEASGTVRLDLVQADANRPTSVFLANAGNLTDDDMEQSEANLSGAATLAAQLSSAWSLSVGLGSVVRTADALERYSDRFPASKAQTSAEFQGNPLLDPERSTQGDLWLEASYPRFQLNLNAFARHIDNYITLTPTDLPKLLPLSPETVFRYVNGEATFLGAELTAAYALRDPLTLSVGGSYLWGEDETLDEPALGVMSPSAELGLRFEPAGRRFFAEGTAHLVASQERAATTRGELETDGYVTADLRLGVSLPQNVSLIAGVNNVFDEHYINHLNAKNPFTAEQLPEPGRIFFANVRYTF